MTYYLVIFLPILVLAYFLYLIFYRIPNDAKTLNKILNGELEINTFTINEYLFRIKNAFYKGCVVVVELSNCLHAKIENKLKLTEIEVRNILNDEVCLRIHTDGDFIDIWVSGINHSKDEIMSIINRVVEGK